MAYETGTATDLADLISKLFTFATANGWTQDQLSTGTGKAAMHRGDIWVSFRWNTSTPLVLGIYQALGYTGGNDPGTHPDDSGNGAVSGTNGAIINERCVNDIGNGAFPSYHFFEDDFYLHVVVEISTGIFRHFGFGTLEKFGDWDGGEYAYGQFQSSGSTQINRGHTALLDGLVSDGGGEPRERDATLHVEGLPGMGGSSKWGVVSSDLSTPSDDTGSNDRVIIKGGFRGGLIARQFGFFTAGPSSGLIPMYPIGVSYFNPGTNFLYFLGFQPAVRGVSIRDMAAGDEVTIGSDVWVFFPLSQRNPTTGGQSTQFSGIAYLKVP